MVDKVEVNTVIAGKSSNLSSHIVANLETAKSISTRDILNSPLNLDDHCDKPENIIVNGFWPATRLYDLSSPQDYVAQSITATSKVLAAVDKNVTKKIIYTSSASIYGNNSFCEESMGPMPLSLHASLKAANEKLVQTFCAQNDIPCILVRLFNMYGGDDKFSVIAKILSAARGETELSVVNGGRAIRDFVHIMDVVNVYIRLLDSNFSGIINVASGIKTSVADIIKRLEENNYPLLFNSIERDEIQCSVASVAKLSKLMDISRFTRVEDYLLAELNNK